MSSCLRPHGLWPIGFLCSQASPGKNYWSGLPFPSPGDLPDPGIEPASPALQADSLPSKPPPTCPLFCRASSGLGLVGGYSPAVVARGVLDLTTSTTVTVWLVRTAMTQCQQRCGLHTRSYFLIILEAGCPRPRAQQDWFCSLSPWFVGAHLSVVSCGQPSLCVCDPVISYQDAGHIRLRPALMTSF